MSNIDETEVKIVDRVEVAPAEGDDESDKSLESSQEESDETTKDVEETPEKETEDEPEVNETKVDENAGSDTDEDEVSIKRVDGETPREYALRLEITRLKADKRKEQAGEILGDAPIQPKKELAPDKKKVLEKYKKEDLDTLKEVFDVMAEDMGFVRQDQLGASTYQQKAGEVLDTFLEKHPEYQPQNDKDNILWNRFKEEYGYYKTPASPKDLKKILEKVHRDVFGIKPTAALNRNEAAKEKITVASHSSASKPSPSREGVKRNAVQSTGLRTDMLKGFSEDEIADLMGE